MGQQGFLINTEDCIGCKAASWPARICIVLTSGLGRVAYTRFAAAIGLWTTSRALACPSNVFAYAVTFSCGHCDNPACVSVCPTGAHAKDPETGLVTVDAEVCIGCGSCVEACPYGAP